MSEHSTGSLRAKLRAKTEESRAGVRELVDEQLKTLAAELSQSVAGVKRTIKTDMRELEHSVEKERLWALTKGLSQSVDRARATIEEDIQKLTGDARRWLGRTVGLGILAALGVMIVAAGGSWWLARDIGNQIEERTSLDLDIVLARQTLRALEEGTWGVQFREEERGRFLVLPEGVEPVTGWTWGDRTAVKLEER